MEIIQYFFRFLYRIRWWIVLVPFFVTIVAILGTRNLEKSFPVDMTIYTGVVSGNGIGSDGGTVNSTVINNTIDNIINIIQSKETLHEVSLHLYARHMIHGDPTKDNEYISAANYRHLQNITPDAVKSLIDKSSVEKTVENLKAYEVASPSNFVYGLFNWNHPHYAYGKLKNIQVTRLGSSDMLRVSYSANDPGVAYQTLLLLEMLYSVEYRKLQFGSTNNAIQYFEDELERVGEQLRESEDSLTSYNVQNRIINYGEQTEQVAAIDVEFQIQYNEVLKKLSNAEASVNYLESLKDENIVYLRDNAEFLARLNQVSDLNTKVAEMGAFFTDSLSDNSSYKQLNHFKTQLKGAENELVDFTQRFSERQYTRDGYPTSNFVSQWLEELLLLEKAKAEIEVIEAKMIEIDELYSHFSPIGSTIKRQERNIDFIERNYLSILSSLNAARLQLKSLEMNSASLKMINPPVFPLNSEPSKRKKLVMAAFAGSLVFIIGIFLLLDLLDRTLRDPIRTRKITGATILGALPGKPTLRQRRYNTLYHDKAIQYLANALQDFFQPGDPYPIVNIMSMKEGRGKSLLIDSLSDYWGSHGVPVKVLRYGDDFDPGSPEFLFADSIHNYLPTGSAQMPPKSIILVEHASLQHYAIPKSLLQEASINLTIFRADKIWSDRNKQLFDRLKEQSGTTPTLICLNRADKQALETYTGMLPPKSLLMKYIYRYTQYGISSS
ncbi:MAG: hypothetical protein PHT65_11870 [Proteiniphilum sp.]|nr:hypothetical protein [Proteiniphilum sp.]